MRVGVMVFTAITVFGALLGSSAGTAAEGERPGPAVRMPVDTVGYATAVHQVEAVVALSDSVEHDRFVSLDREIAESGGGNMVAAICPHDDYLYAGPVYVHVMRHVRAPLVVLFGVSHAARRRGIQGKLIFDSHRAWKGPYGETPVSGLREAVIDALPQEVVLVSDELHGIEHSLEAFIPFLQYYERRNGDAIFREGSGAGERRIEIVPILVPRLAGSLFGSTADTLAAVLSRAFKRSGAELGRDVALLISADCVHYGDEKWGGRNYAPFGVDRAGYEKGVEQELDIIAGTLTGTLTGGRIAAFRERIDSGEFEWPYKVTWCGVYSIPFGLRVLVGLRELSGRGEPQGIMLRQATSIDPGKIPLERTGLGVTNIGTLRHWVGYAGIGYW